MKVWAIALLLCYAAAPALADTAVRIRTEAWTPADERGRRLFRLSFDPYQCVERRWGALGAEFASCRDGALKRRWYDAQQRLRNQIDRIYDARMDFALKELEAGRGGVPAAPDTDT